MGALKPYLSLSGTSQFLEAFSSAMKKRYARYQRGNQNARSSILCFCRCADAWGLVLCQRGRDDDGTSSTDVCERGRPSHHLAAPFKRHIGADWLTLYVHNIWEAPIKAWRSKGSTCRLWAVLAGHLAMDVTKGGGGNRSVESALKGYGYSLNKLECLKK